MTVIKTLPYDRSVTVMCHLCETIASLMNLPVRF